MCGPPTELPELSCRSIEKHANHRLPNTSVFPRVCEALGVSQPGFYAWLNRSPSARSRSDEAVGQWVKANFVASDRTYGVRRVWRDLLAEGVGCRPTRFRYHCTFASHQGRIDVVAKAPVKTAAVANICALGLVALSSSA